MHEAVEQPRDDDDIAEQLRPVLERPVRRDDGRGSFVAAHQHIGEFVAGVGRQPAQEQVVASRISIACSKMRTVTSLCGMAGSTA